MTAPSSSPAANSTIPRTRCETERDACRRGACSILAAMALKCSLGWTWSPDRAAPFRRPVPLYRSRLPVPEDLGIVLIRNHKQNTRWCGTHEYSCETRKASCVICRPIYPDRPQPSKNSRSAAVCEKMLGKRKKLAITCRFVRHLIIGRLLKAALNLVVICHSHYLLYSHGLPRTTFESGLYSRGTTGRHQHYRLAGRRSSARSENVDPKTRALISQFRQAMRARMQQLGIDPPFRARSGR